MVPVFDDDLTARLLHPTGVLSPDRLPDDSVLPLGSLQGPSGPYLRWTAGPLGGFPQARRFADQNFRPAARREYRKQRSRGGGEEGGDGQ